MNNNVEDRIWNTLEDIIEGADAEELSDDRTSNYEYSNSVIWNVWPSSESSVDLYSEGREFYISTSDVRRINDRIYREYVNNAVSDLTGDMRRSVADDGTRFCYEAGDGFLWRPYTLWY